MSETLEFLEARVEALEKENAKLMEREKKATELLKEILVVLEENKEKQAIGQARPNLNHGSSYP